MTEPDDFHAISQSFEAIVRARHSVRGFLPNPVSPNTLRAIFEIAQQAPSNCNVQPWQTYVASGELRCKLAQQLHAAASAGAPAPDFPLPDYCGEHRDRKVACAAALYDNVGVRRDDKVGRATQLLRNFAFFDAPHVAFVCGLKQLGVPSAIDVGAYVQTLLLAMQSRGVGSCAQVALTLYPDTVRKVLGFGEELAILVGISFGYEDPNPGSGRSVNGHSPRKALVVFGLFCHQSSRLA